MINPLGLAGWVVALENGLSAQFLGGWSLAEQYGQIDLAPEFCSAKVAACREVSRRIQSADSSSAAFCLKMELYEIQPSPPLCLASDMIRVR